MTSNYKVFFKTPYNHDTNEESDQGALRCLDESRTLQSQAKEADINTIVRNFGVTGVLPQVAMPPTYETFGEIFDFQSAMNAIKDATDSFLALPANIRSRFDNDPAKFVGYVDHCIEREDLDPLREMGLALPIKPAEPTSEEAGTPAAPPK